jgi:DNA replication and repair protein RecF
VRAAVLAPPRELRVEVEIIPGRANRAKLGASPVPRVRDILGALRVVLFAPEDLAVVRGDPGERRRFLDELLVARRPALAGVRADYDRVLRQRAALLKSAGAARRAGTSLGALDAWDAHLAEYGAELMQARLSTVAQLRPHATAAWSQLAPGADPLALHYATALADFLPGDESVPDAPTLRAALAEQLTQVRTAELERGVNLAGPHRDDLELQIGPLPARSHASQGESWSVALALRLASYDLLRADELPGGDPVLLLDDVFAQLDEERREQLAVVAGKAEQAVITAAVADDVPRQLAGQRFEVLGGMVRAHD